MIDPHLVHRVSISWGGNLPFTNSANIDGPLSSIEIPAAQYLSSGANVDSEAVFVASTPCHIRTEMDTKKELVDYLRNTQKAAEIEAKVNGINLWVLMGAIAIVSWQLIEVVKPTFWAQRDSLVRVLICAEAAYLFLLMCLPTNGLRSDLRFSSKSPNETPILMIVWGIWLLIPPVLYFVIFGWGISAVVLALFGVMAVSLHVIHILSKLWDSREEQDQLPKPEFAHTNRSSELAGSAFCIVFAAMLIEQLAALAPQVSWGDKDFVKCLALLAAVYLLAMVAIRRKKDSHRNQWTYELETDLIVGSVSPEVALRRIEHRVLGPRLQDVMDRFFDDMDNRFSSFGKSVDHFKEALAAIEQVPTMYPAERAARCMKVSAETEEALKGLREKHDAFSKYLEKLGGLKTDKRNASSLQALVERSNAYRSRIDSAGAEFDAMVRHVTAKEAQPVNDQGPK